VLTRPAAAAAPGPAVVILARVSYDGWHILDDLKHYAETGTPSRRKLAHRHH
jgi:hypothetical protein